MSTSLFTWPAASAAADDRVGRLPTTTEFARAQAQGGRRLLALPFDTLRTIYWSGVRNGVVPRSLIAWGNFERWLDSVESVTLGPLARRR